MVVLVRGPAASAALDLKLVRKVKGEDENIPVEITAATMGLYALAFETGPAEVELSIKRPEELPPARPTKIRIDALVPSDQLSTPPTLITNEVDVLPTGKPVILTWSERGFVAS